MATNNSTMSLASSSGSSGESVNTVVLRAAAQGGEPSSADHHGPQQQHPGPCQDPAPPAPASAPARIEPSGRPVQPRPVSVHSSDTSSLQQLPPPALDPAAETTTTRRQYGTISLGSSYTPSLRPGEYSSTTIRPPNRRPAPAASITTPLFTGSALGRAPQTITTTGSGYVGSSYTDDGERAAHAQSGSGAGRLELPTEEETPRQRVLSYLATGESSNLTSFGDEMGVAAPLSPTDEESAAAGQPLVETALKVAFWVMLVLIVAMTPIYVWMIWAFLRRWAW